MDDQRRVAMVENTIADPDVTAGRRWRFQLDNHLGTATLEVDAAGKVISYEEYHPYGTSALRVQDSTAGVSQKRYRYTGKERDEETSLYYHGARYYASWLGRWTAADPIGVAGGLNLFEYVSGNPIRLHDPSGHREFPGQNSANVDRLRKQGLSDERIQELIDRKPSHKKPKGGASSKVGSGSKGATGTGGGAGDTVAPSVGGTSPESKRSAGNAATAEAGIVTHDALVRDSYHGKTTQVSEEAVSKVRVAQAAAEAEPATAAENLEKARTLAESASNERDIVRTAAQERQSAIGRSMSRAMQKPSKPFAARVAKVVPPGETPGFKTYETIAKNVANTRGSANSLATGLKVAGAVGLAVGVGVSAYNVATAPKGQVGRTAAEEGGGLVFDLAGGIAGAEIGAGVVGAALTALAVSNPVGWAAVAGAV
jgi:RHS repeat-associated protein